MRCAFDARLGRLSFSLLVSSLLHVLVIGFLYQGKSREGSGAGGGGDHFFRTALHVTLTDSSVRLPDSPALAKPKPPWKSLKQENERAVPESPSTSDSLPEMKFSVGEGALAFPGVIYYPTGMLTAKPQPLTELEVDYDRVADTVPSGKIILDLWINEQGNVVNTVVEYNGLPEVVFQIVAKAFSNLRFVPGELNGQRVGSVMRVEVSYDDLRDLVP